MTKLPRLPNDITLASLPNHQIHDELLLEVPTENTPAAMSLVQQHMEEPFAQPCRDVLGVSLPVDVACGPNWAAVK